MPPWASQYIGREFDQSSWHCWQLCRHIADQHLGFQWPQFGWAAGEARASEIHDQSKNWQELCDRQSFLDGWRGETLGDVVVIRMGSFCGHVGMALAPNKMIHVEEGTPTSIVELRSAMWKRRVEGIYRWIG